MKKLLKYFLCLSIAFLFTIKVNAVCNDEDLNEWATKVEPLFKENLVVGSDALPYAYFLSITPYREDVKIIVYDVNGKKAEGQYFESVQLYGVGAKTNLEEETYKIEVYGGSESGCPNELLKTLSYTVPRFNRMVKSQKCVDNPELEICKTFTNATKDMTEEEFNKTIDKYIKENKTNLTFMEIVKKVLSYAVFIIVPLIIVGLIYFVKVKKFKKEERDK